MPSSCGELISDGGMLYHLCGRPVTENGKCKFHNNVDRKRKIRHELWKKEFEKRMAEKPCTRCNGTGVEP